MEIEDNLSDASLVEDDEEEDEIIDYPEVEPEASLIETNALLMEESVPEEADPDTPELPQSPDFHGFTEEDFELRSEAAPVSGDEDYNKNVNYPFPKDMSDCSGHYADKVPFYTVHFADVPKAPVVQPNLEQNNAAAEEKKVKPLKIKKSSISTPSPLLQRESREWKPSSQFFKPLTAGKCLPFTK